MAEQELSADDLASTSSIVNFTSEYTRPLSCALLNLQQNYLIPYTTLYNTVSDQFTIGSNANKIVDDGASGDIFSRLTVAEVRDISTGIQAVSDSIGFIQSQLVKASDTASFYSNDITIRTAGTTGGCHC